MGIQVGRTSEIIEIAYLWEYGVSLVLFTVQYCNLALKSTIKYLSRLSFSKLISNGECFPKHFKMKNICFKSLDTAEGINSNHLTLKHKMFSLSLSLYRSPEFRGIYAPSPKKPISKS